MAIAATDIKLLASERMADTTDGGGRRTGNVIPDGVAGNIFPKVSRLDSVYGRANMRKVYMGVQTASVDTFAGAHAVVMQPPFNKNIIINLFSTASDFDDRNAARDRIESYVVAGPESRMVLNGRQLVGQGAITVYQNVDDSLPEVSSVFCLSKETAGVTIYQQYVRITDITHEVRTFTDDQGDFKRRVVTMKMSAPLRFEFSGPDGPARMSNFTKPALVRTTTVADAARYYSIKQVKEAAPADALTIKVESVYSPIVPTTQRESPVSNAEISGASHVAAAGTAMLPFSSIAVIPSLPRNFTTTRTPFPIKPGSLQLYLAFQDNTGKGNTVTDDGKGNIVSTGGSGGNTIYGGTIDYISGVLVVDLSWANGFGAGALHASYIPAVAVTQVAHTKGLPITLGTRGTVFVQTLHPLPAPGTLVFDFRALGKWYRLRDNGAGVLAGDDPAYGVGSIDYTSGAMVTTIGALPDVGSSVMLAWASPAHYAIRAGATSDAGATVLQKFTLPNLPVKPGSVTVTYLVNTVATTATCDVYGVINNHGINGTVDHTTGLVELEYTTKLPDVGSTMSVFYQQEVPSTADPTSASGTVQLTDLTSFVIDKGPQNIAAKGLTFGLPVEYNYGRVGIVQCIDDGSGNIITRRQLLILTNPFTHGTAKFSITGGQVIGTVNYVTGEASITAEGIVGEEFRWDYLISVWGSVMAGATRG